MQPVPPLFTSLECDSVTAVTVGYLEDQLWRLQVASDEDPEFWPKKGSDEGVCQVVKTRQLGGIWTQLLRRQSGVFVNERLEKPFAVPGGYRTRYGGAEVDKGLEVFARKV